MGVLGAMCYGGYYVYSNLSTIPSSSDSSVLGASGDASEAGLDGTDGTATTTSQGSDGQVLYRNVQVDNDTMHYGNLACVTPDNYQDYDSEYLELVNVYESRVPSYSVSGIDAELCSNVVDEFNSMLSDFYESTGNSSTMVRLAYLYPEDLTDSSKCDHITGLALNLSSYDGDTIQDFNGSGDYSWILDRADKYGFIQRYPYGKVDVTGIDESSHFRYVGLPHSSYMKENDLCLEEYVELVKGYKYNDPLEYTTYNGRTYDIYYVPMDDNNPITNIPILMDMEYSISGNNMDGFIVTVKVAG